MCFQLVMIQYFIFDSQCFQDFRRGQTGHLVLNHVSSRETERV